MFRRSARTCVLALLASTAAACGGSGGGGGVQPPVVAVLGDGTFQGTYFAVLMTGGHSASGTEGRATTGTIAADGAGHASHTQTINDAGVISGPTTTSYDFAVASDGTLELSFGATVFARGGIASDGRMAVLASVIPGAFPGLLVLLRREGLHGPASLSGPYHMSAALHGGFTGDSLMVISSGAFDGIGTFTGTHTLNGMGTVVVAGASTDYYTVIGDGTSTFMHDAVGPPVMEGGVGAGGDVAVWAGSTTDMTALNLTVAMKAPASAGLGTLQGAYWIVLYERDPGSDDFRSLHGTATADGVGGLTLLATSNTEGVIAAEPLQATTYSVSPSGKISVDAGGSVLVGGLTEGGRYAVLAGGLTPGSNPTIAVLCRK